MKPILKYALCGAGVLLLSGAVSAQVTNVQTPQQQKRLEVLQAGSKGAAGLTTLATAMKDPDVLIRRAAVRSLGEIGKPAQPALEAAFKTDADELVRRSALRLLLEIDPAGMGGILEAGLADPNQLVRVAAVETLTGLKPYSAKTTELLRKAQQDKDDSVSQVAAQALWPYHKDAVSVRERPEHKDHQLAVIQTIPLPESGWKFQTDAGQTGHLQEWFKPDFNDSDWKAIAIGKAWEDEGHNYDGVAWYRRAVTLPAKPAALDGVDLVFDAVDESAWVWINGQYAGAHDIGAEGWKDRFYVDAGDLLKWGEENQITVRVMDRKAAGGIWKPVYFEVVKQ